MVENKKEMLISLLKQHSKAFIEGTPRTRVSTGEMRFRLIESTKTVQRRPNRFSPSERAP